MEEAPTFDTGNQAFAAGLNDVTEYARLHGVNAADRPGWQSSPEGWVPPAVTSGGAGAAAAARMWNVINSTEEGGPPQVTVVPNGGVIRPDLGYSNAMVITDIDTAHPIVAGDRGYLSITKPDDLACALVVDDTWTTSGNPSLPWPMTPDDETGEPALYQTYYPIFEVLAYDETRASDAALNFADDGLQVFTLAASAPLMVITYHWRNDSTDKVFSVLTVFPPSGDFQPEPSP